MSVHRIPLALPIQTRSGALTIDSRTTNVVFEETSGQQEVVKRPGLVYTTQIVAVTPPAFLQSQGLFSYQNYAVSVINNNINKTTVPGYVTTSVSAMSASTSQSYAVKTFLDAYLFIHNKVTAYLVSSSFVVTTPASIPAGPYVSGTVFLDNYVFVGLSANNRIYNSGLNDPTTWGALNYISFEQTTDTLVAIAKHLNYLLAFGKYSTQFFYDAGNPTGSPLSLAASYTLETGCSNGDSIVSTDNSVIWCGATKTNGKAVYQMEGTTANTISNQYISRILELDGLAKVTAYAYKFAGHSLYILNLDTSKVTLVYDMTTKSWHQWTMYAVASNDQTSPGTSYEMYFRPTFYAEINALPYCLDDDAAYLYYLSTTTYQDNSNPIYARVVTPIMDQQSTKRKFYNRLEAVGDKIAGGVLQVRHSGNDYSTYSTFRNLDLSVGRAQMYQCGADRRRSWEFLCTSNVPLRLQAIEVEVKIGDMDQEQGN